MSDFLQFEGCDNTWNPWIGCTEVAPGCARCPAAALDARGFFGSRHWGEGVPRQRTSPKNWEQPRQWNLRPFSECGACGWRGEAGAHSSCPACGKRSLQDTRRRVFCASLADVFDSEVPSQWWADLFKLIVATSNLDWVLLTKRIDNVRPRLRSIGAVGMPFNVWLGITVGSQLEANSSIPELLEVPARVRWLNLVLREPVTLTAIDQRIFDGRLDALRGRFSWGTGEVTKEKGRLSWVVASGETGPNARPMHPAWIRAIRDACASTRTPFLFRQWGDWVPRSACYHTFGDGSSCVDQDPGAKKWPCIRLTEKGGNGWDLASEGEGCSAYMQKIGCTAAGRLLDGVEHNAIPSGG